MTQAITLVLDTNAWLDLLVFADPGLQGLVAEAESGRVVIATDARALAELARVLRYDALRIDAVAVATHFENAQRLSRSFDVPSHALPRCRDPDDQMFLEIAVATRAAALLTRDAELLRMGRRMQREHAVAIIEPRDWRSVIDTPRNAS
jgi:putative PIN family toxin of toxin-antitoxin system